MITEINNSYNEYKYFISEYLLPLLGIPSEIEIEKYGKEKDDTALVLYQNKYLIFSSHNRNMYRVKVQHDIIDDSIKLVRNIITSFFTISKYRMDEESTTRINNHYSSNIQLETVYRMAVQKGICNWVVGTNSVAVERLFQIIEKWSVQTYEGKKVTFGFVINPDKEVDEDTQYGNWFDFLDDDFSAVFTDCVNSVIELDKNCNFYKYLSITEDNHVEGYKLTHETSYRFSHIMQKYIFENKVGVFLLNNGDIIISKRGAIKFVKRNLKWLNFSYDAFKNAFGDFLNEHNIEEQLLQQVFASMLDVSFSHTGGIISVISNVNDIINKADKNEEILSISDYLLSNATDEEIANELRNENNDKEINKRILKRRVLKAFIDDKSFTQLDRKLRCELISLDGACILDKIGNICSCGAIIKNDSGSSGGGRGAASKKLSAYGFSIKISTDGYIELYIDRDLKYAIK